MCLFIVFGIYGFVDEIKMYYYCTVWKQRTTSYWRVKQTQVLRGQCGGMGYWLCLSVRALQKPPSCRSISKLSTYSEPSWDNGSFKTIWVKIRAQKKN